MGKMIFELKPKKEKCIEDTYKKAVKELNEFFGIEWGKNLPSLIIIPDRKTFNKILRRETADWHGATSTKEVIFILDYKKISNVHSKEEYSSIIKHELCHQFQDVLSNNNYKPIWLSEGLATYLSMQLYPKMGPRKFRRFLSFYNKGGGQVYQEAGFVVKMLVEKFGKHKLLKLLRSLKKIDSEKGFKKSFKDIYGFEINYKEINRSWEK